MRLGEKKLIARPWALMLALVLLCSVLFSCAPVEKIKAGITNKFTSEQELDSALQVAEEFFDALMDNDYPRAYGLISSEDKKGRSLEDFEQEFKDVTQIVWIKMNWVEVKNNIAVVCIDFIDSYDGTEKTYKDRKVSLVKEEDGSWKINFWP